MQAAIVQDLLKHWVLLHALQLTIIITFYFRHVVHIIGTIEQRRSTNMDSRNALQNRCLHTITLVGADETLDGDAQRCILGQYLNANFDVKVIFQKSTWYFNSSTNLNLTFKTFFNSDVIQNCGPIRKWYSTVFLNWGEKTSSSACAQSAFWNTAHTLSTNTLHMKHHLRYGRRKGEAGGPSPRLGIWILIFSC